MTRLPLYAGAAVLALTQLAPLPADAATHRERHCHTRLLTIDGTQMLGESNRVCVTLAYRPTRHAPGVWAPAMHATFSNEHEDRLGSPTGRSWLDTWRHTRHGNREVTHDHLGVRYVNAGEPARWDDVQQGIRHGNTMTVRIRLRVQPDPWTDYDGYWQRFTFHVCRDGGC